MTSSRYIALSTVFALTLTLFGCNGGRGDKGGDEGDGQTTDKAQGLGEGDDDEGDEEGDEDDGWGEGEGEPQREDLPFGDFLFMFLRSRSFQAAHISFPLEVEEEDASSRVITSGAAFRKYFSWPFEGECTLLLTDIDEMERLEEAPGQLGKPVVVEVIDLPHMGMRSYEFAWSDSLWLLRGVRNPDPRGRYADFLDFYNRFATDTVFQQERIAPEVRLTSADPDDEMGQIEGILTATQWPAFRPALPSGVITNIRVGQEFDETQRVVVAWVGLASGFVQTFTFEQRKGQWVLTAFDD